jgi:type II secretory pathway pseudopilin PulG
MKMSRYKGSTLPELLVSMLLAGIVLLVVFGGLNMLQYVLRQQARMEIGTGLLRLQRHEVLLEMTDSVSVSDSARYYRDGVVVETLERWDK